MRSALVVVAAALVALTRGQGSSPDDEGELWAVLLAGSKGWYNYRHQADVCHAYQILHQHGVPSDHIVVMMYDDIAFNRRNPTPGVIINRPGGPDVYGGVPKDYTGRHVNPNTFYKVLKGDAEGLVGVGSGKVLQSGPNDRVFINLVDHGAPGIFGFPHTYMHARRFSNVILEMHREKKFKEMMIYLESCESGSMFKDLPDDVGVYAVSAANETQPSFACYLDHRLGTFLGDVFSVKWMEDTDRENTTTETLKEQYLLVKKEVNTSEVRQWGETQIDSEMSSVFFGNETSEVDDFGPFPAYSDPCLNTSVRNPDVPLAILQKQLEDAEDQDEANQLQQEINELLQNRSFVRETMKKVALQVSGDAALVEHLTDDTHHTLARWQCFEHSVEEFDRSCFNLGTNPYALRVVQTIVNLCEHGYTAEEFKAATGTVCVHEPVHGIN